MVDTILGRKIGMTQVFNDRGEIVPVSVIEAGPCIVTQLKSVETDGYVAVQVGFGEIRARLVNKPETGHYKKAGLEPMRYVREIRTDDTSEYELGSEITCDIFQPGIRVKVTGISKGKGFQGVVKRFHFHDGAARFELVAEGDDGHHHHLVCTKCSQTVELKECFPAEIERRIAETNGFKAVTHKLEFFGICPDCQR